MSVRREIALKITCYVEVGGVLEWLASWGLAFLI